MTSDTYYPLKSVGDYVDTYQQKTIVPEMPASRMSWLGEAPTKRQADRYEIHRDIVLQERLAQVTSEHSLAEGSDRARLADEMNNLHRELRGVL